MRWSRYYLSTTREVPAAAEVPSHRLMLRSGMIKKVAAGVYAYLPLGWRTLAKLIAIVRRELDRAGAVELRLPSLQPAELWRQSGRWERFGELLLRLKDRTGRDLCLGPAHEEVITDLVRRDLASYRQLPVSLYQVRTKFRDEIRPRSGLMRGREFLMADAYSFHAGEAGLEATYEAMKGAYHRVLTACGLDFTVVEADTGATGGSASHEFMVMAESGEEALVRCAADGYAADVELAAAGPLPQPPAGEPAPLLAVDTPGATSVAAVAALLGVDPRRVVKTLVYDSDRGVVLVAVRGDREVNEVKLARLLDAAYVTLAPPPLVAEATGSPVGFAGPVGLPAGARLIADESVRGLTNFVCGANRADTHLKGVNWGRDAEPGEWADVLQVGDGDPSPAGGGPLALSRGIAVGHLFKLGAEYSAALGGTFSDERGEERPMLMGSYGLEIGRTVAAAIEQNHDADGIVWPLPLAPFEVEVLAVNPDDAAVRAAADALHAELEERGVEVLYDDRDERPGVKFKDADLIGIPLRAVVGARSLGAGQVEISLRQEREKIPVPRGEAAARLAELRAQLAGEAPVPVPA
jgi:prolyl-tRNA synthetase